MMNDTDKSHSFLRDLALGFLPHELVRTCLFLIVRPTEFVSDVQRCNWKNKSHPAAFLLAALAIYAFVDPWVDTYSFEPQWYESYLELNSEDQARFQETLDLTDEQVESANSEFFLANATAASNAIKETAGSLDVQDIAIYLAGKDPEIAKSFSTGVARVKRFKKVTSYALAPLLALAWAIGALIVHGLLSSTGQPFRVAFHILIYWQGFWLVITQGVVIVGKFTIPAGPSLIGIGFAFFEFAFFAASFLHGCWLFGLVYHRSVLLRILAIVLAFLAALVINTTAFFAIAIVMSLIP